MTVIARLPTAVNPGATLHASEDDPASNDQDFTERVEFIRRQPVRLPAIFLRENKTKSPPMGQRILGNGYGACNSTRHGPDGAGRRQV